MYKLLAVSLKLKSSCTLLCIAMQSAYSYFGGALLIRAAESICTRNFSSGDYGNKGCQVFKEGMQN